jgi:ABC-type arginine transport system permease subunit
VGAEIIVVVIAGTIIVTAGAAIMGVGAGTVEAATAAGMTSVHSACYM